MYLTGKAANITKAGKFPEGVCCLLSLTREGFIYGLLPITINQLCAVI